MDVAGVWEVALGGGDLLTAQAGRNSVNVSFLEPGLPPQVHVFGRWSPKPRVSTCDAGQKCVVIFACDLFNANVLETEMCELEFAEKLRATDGECMPWPQWYLRGPRRTLDWELGVVSHGERHCAP